MAKIGELLKSDLGKGVAIGVGVAAVGLVLFPALRPAARSAIKSGLLVYEKGRVFVGEAVESLEDVVAEVRAEMAGQEFTVDSVQGSHEEAMARTEGES